MPHRATPGSGMDGRGTWTAAHAPTAHAGRCELPAERGMTHLRVAGGRPPARAGCRGGVPREHVPHGCATRIPPRRCSHARPRAASSAPLSARDTCRPRTRTAATSFQYPTSPRRQLQKPCTATDCSWHATSWKSHGNRMSCLV